MIDSHVHCRGWFWWIKETIAHALNVAERTGLDAIFDMPNTDPTVTIYDLARLRLLEAEKARSNVTYGLYIGISKNPEQVKGAVESYHKLFLTEDKIVGLVGLKMFAGESVGDLTVKELKDQEMVYQTLEKEGYDGVLTVHCEKESLMRPAIWNPNNPITHGNARPEIAEVESIEDQIKLCLATGYAVKEGFGRIHIAHVSTPESVDLINLYRNRLNITCEVTPHHLLLNESVMTMPDGIMYKVNPPLREYSTQALLMEKFLEGKIDTLASDHAPHTYKEKTEKHMSGHPVLAVWPVYLRLLEQRGAKREMLEEMMHEKVNEIFGTNIRTIEERGLKRRIFLTHDENDCDFYAFNPTKYISSIAK